MSFVTALALGLGLLVVAPWLAHRFRRRRADEVAFAPVHLVPAAPPRARRRADLEDKALFGVRVAQVVGLALLGATPLVDCSRLALDRGGASVAVVVVVDDSMSMRVRPGAGAGTRFDRARAAALEVASGLRDGDAVGIVLAGAPARVAFAVSTDVRAARDAIERLEPSDRATDLDGALDLAGSMTSELPQIDKRIVLLSDRADGRPDASPLGARGAATLWAPLDLGEGAADCAVVRAERSGERVRARVACGPGASAEGRSLLLVKASGGAPLAKVPAPPGAAGDAWLSVQAAPAEAGDLVVRLDGADAIAADDAAPVTARLRSGELGVVASVAGEAGGPPVIERAFSALELDLGLRPLPVVPDRKEDVLGLAGLVVDDPPGFGPEVRRVLAAFVERGGVLVLALGSGAAAAPIGTGLEPALARPLGWGPSPSKGVDLAEGRGLLGEGLASLADFGPKGRATLDPADLAGAEVLVRFTDGAPLVVRRAVGRGAVWLVTVPLSVDASDLPLRPAFLGLLSAIAEDARRGLAASRSEPGAAWPFPGARAVEVTPLGDGAPAGDAAKPLAVSRGPSGPFVVPGRLGLHRVRVDGADEVRVVEPVARELDLRPRPLDAQAPGARTGGAAVRTDASWAVALALLALLAGELVLRFVRRREAAASALRVARGVPRSGASAPPAAAAKVRAAMVAPARVVRVRAPSRRPSPRLRAFALAFAFAFAFALAACGGGGRYGHAVTYAPTSDEASALEGAAPYDPVMAERREVWHAKKVHLFGVVRSRGAGPTGTSALTVGVRRLESRNLCSSKSDEDTCRVTVSDQDFGVVHVVAKLSGDDDVGQEAVAPGSLVRVVGAVGEDVDRDDGAPVVRAAFLRHFPRGAYVTRASAEVMRQ